MARTSNSICAEIQSLDFAFPETQGNVLQNLNLAVRKREVVAIVGKSGCGKTTLLRLLAGLLEPSSGQVLIDEQSPLRYSRSGKIALLSQQAVLMPWRTVAENVRLPRDFPRVASSEKTDEEAIQAVGLMPQINHYPHQLSGGMKQRAVLARSIVADPQLMLMDEPFSALDEFNRLAMGELFHKIHKSSGSTAVIVTHSISEAVFLSDRVVILSEAPASIVAEFEIDLGPSRDPSTLDAPEFSEYIAKIRRAVV